MDIGIGLPNSLAGVRGRDLVRWAADADEAGFALLGTIGRIAYHTHEELIALAAAAAVTERIRLMSTVMVSPPRQTVLLAKQAATLDHIAEGRFELGLGIGTRDDDYTTLGAAFQRRGSRLDEQLDLLESVWRGELLPGAQRPVGPAPYSDGGPKVILGGGSDAALRRAGRRADAWLSSPAPADVVAERYRQVRAAAEEAGRPIPRLLAARYFALGEVQDEVLRNVRSYYIYRDVDRSGPVAAAVLRSPDDIRAAITQHEEVGVDGLFLWPMVAGIDQLRSLTEVVKPPAWGTAGRRA